MLGFIYKLSLFSSDLKNLEDRRCFFFYLNNCKILILTPLLPISKKYAGQFKRETANKNKHFMGTKT